MRFFRNILVNFFPYWMADETLAETVHLLFNLDAHLYTVALQSELAKRELASGGHHVLKQILDNYLLNQVFADSQALSPEQEELLSLDQRRLLSELAWRQDLKVGDKVDVVFTSGNYSNRVQHWVPGVVTNIVVPVTNDEEAQELPQLSDHKIYVQIQGLPVPVREVMVARDSLELARPATFTSDFEWRWRLDEGDLVDCIDSEGTWYISTILAVRDVGEAGSKVREAYIGYRYYDPEGHKVDDDTKQKYVGWSNKYDIWLPVVSPQIQKMKTVSRCYKAAGRSTMIYDDHSLSDSTDVLHNSPAVRHWVVSRANHFQNIKCITDFVNEFGQRDGFETILRLITGEQTINLKHASYLFEFLAKTMPLWHRQFAVDYIPRFRVAFEKYFSSMAITVKFHRDAFSSSIKSLTTILKRYYPSSPSSTTPKEVDDNYPLIQQNVSFLASITLLQSDKLEQRVAAMNQINEVLKGTRYSTYGRKGLTDKDILDRLLKNNVLSAIFGGAESHVQLVQRGEEVIRFLIDAKAFNEHEIRTVWRAIQQGDQATKLEFYKILEALQVKLRNDDIALIISLFGTDIDPQDFMRQEIECVSKLIQYCQRQTTAVCRAAELFFEIACKAKPYSNELIESAMDKLINLLLHQDRAMKLEYINLCYDRIEHSIASYQCVRLMHKILDNIPKEKMGTIPSGQEIATDLINKYNTITLVIFDLSRYSELANAEFARSGLTPENFEGSEVLGLPFSHRSQIASRLALVKLLLTYSAT